MAAHLWRAKRHQNRRAITIALCAAMIAGLLLVAPAASAASTPQQAVDQAAANSAANGGITSYISVVDRSSGAVLAGTGNADVQVASESIMKLFIAAYYAVSVGGYWNLPAATESTLADMIRRSHDQIASAYWRAGITSFVAARYGMQRTANNPANPGRWGSTRITAADMTQFMFQMSRDALVGPWLMDVMAQTTAFGADGYNQAFGMNALSGIHGSKQGWGQDNWTNQRSAIHSVGYTDKYFVAILQTGSSGSYGIMPSTATYSARTIADSANDDAYNPIGDMAVKRVGSYAQVGGWSIDPDAQTAATQVHIYDYGPGGVNRAYVLTANANRPDVAGAYPGAGAAHGYNFLVPLSGYGSHRICAYAINIGTGTGNTTIGCSFVQVGNPFGQFDRAASSSGRTAVSGWAMDPHAPTTSVRVHLYDSGPLGTTGYSLSANDSRPDVGSSYPGYGNNHGWSASLPLAGDGSHRLCAYAIGRINMTIGCRVVTVKNTWSSFDSATLGSNSNIRVRGWALSQLAPSTAIRVHVYVSGPQGTVGYSIPTGVTRADVGATLPGTGRSHGFDTSVPLIGFGTHRVCGFAITPDGQNRSIGCKTVSTSPAAKVQADAAAAFDVAEVGDSSPAAITTDAASGPVATPESATAATTAVSDQTTAEGTSAAATSDSAPSEIPLPSGMTSGVEATATAVEPTAGTTAVTTTGAPSTG